MMFQYKKSEADFLAAIALDKTCAEAYNNLAGVYIKLGKYDLTEQNAKKAQGLSPELGDANLQVAVEGNKLDKQIAKKPTAELHNLRGLLAMYQGAFGNAKLDFEQAIKIDPKYADAYGNLGDVFIKLALPAKAAKCYIEAAKLDNQFDIKRLDVANKWIHLEKETKANPKADIYYELGMLAFQQKSIETIKVAKECFEKSIALDKEFGPARNTIHVVTDILQKFGLAT